MQPTFNHIDHSVWYDGVRGRCNIIEGRFMRAHLELSDDQIAQVMLSPVGPIIVGEAPGDHTSSLLPMFPYPNTSAGGRLLRFSGMSAFDYLRTFHRVNLMEEKPPTWRLVDARRAAAELLLRYVGHPLVLLGKKVQEAFGVGGDGWGEVHGCLYCAIPHPSGLNTLSNSPVVQDKMRLTLWRAADAWVYPTSGFFTDRPLCGTCGKLVKGHPGHPGAVGVHVVCPGEVPRIRSAT